MTNLPDTMYEYRFDNTQDYEEDEQDDFYVCEECRCLISKWEYEFQDELCDDCFYADDTEDEDEE